VNRETYSNDVRKITYRDPYGNEIGFGGAPLGYITPWADGSWAADRSLSVRSVNDGRALPAYLVTATCSSPASGAGVHGEQPRLTSPDGT
jgi:hypothetical protein